MSQCIIFNWRTQWSIPPFTLCLQDIVPRTSPQIGRQQDEDKLKLKFTLGECSCKRGHSPLWSFSGYIQGQEKSPWQVCLNYYQKICYTMAQMAPCYDTVTILFDSPKILTRRLILRRVNVEIAPSVWWSYYHLLLVHKLQGLLVFDFHHILFIRYFFIRRIEHC